MIIKHVFFDLDHTLWDFDKNSRLCFQQIFEEQDVKLEIDVFLETYIPINFNYWKLFREEKISKQDLRYKRLRETFDVLNYKITDDVINLISDDFINYLSNYNHLISGTIDLLEYLNPKYQLHIITNGFKEVQHLKIKKSKIAKYFKTIVTSDDIGVKKPNPKIFKFALNKAIAIIGESVMIGDSLEADVIGGMNFGIKSIHLDLFKIKQKENKQYITVNSLLELKQYL